MSTKLEIPICANHLNSSGIIALIIAMLGNIMYIRELIPDTLANINTKADSNRKTKRFINQIVALESDLAAIISQPYSSVVKVSFLIGSIVLCPREGIGHKYNIKICNIIF